MAKAGRSAGRRVRRPDDREAAELLRGIAELRDEIEALSKRIDKAERALVSNWQEEGRSRFQFAPRSPHGEARN